MPDGTIREIERTNLPGKTKLRIENVLPNITRVTNLNKVLIFNEISDFLILLKLYCTF